MEKKKYKVIDIITEFDNFGESVNSYTMVLGYTYAKSINDAIKNIKKRNNIKRKGNCYIDDNYSTDSSTEHNIKAELITEKGE